MISGLWKEKIKIPHCWKLHTQPFYNKSIQEASESNGMHARGHGSVKELYALVISTFFQEIFFSEVKLIEWQITAFPKMLSFPIQSGFYMLKKIFWCISPDPRNSPPFAKWLTSVNISSEWCFINLPLMVLKVTMLDGWKSPGWPVTQETMSEFCSCHSMVIGVWVN